MRLRILTWFVVKYTEMREHHSLRLFGRLLDDPYLFHLNERSVPGAFAVGLFCAWIPLPFQMFIAAAVAIFVRVNVPLSIILVWLTNPVTIPPMFYFAYVLGTWFTGDKAQHFEFELSYEWLMQEIHIIGEPLLVGCTVLAVSSSIIGFFTMRLLWNERLSRLLHIKVERHQRTQRNNNTRGNNNTPAD